MEQDINRTSGMDSIVRLHGSLQDINRTSGWGDFV